MFKKDKKSHSESPRRKLIVTNETELKTIKEVHHENPSGEIHTYSVIEKGEEIVNVHKFREIEEKAGTLSEGIEAMKIEDVEKTQNLEEEKETAEERRQRMNRERVQRFRQRQKEKKEAEKKKAQRSQSPDEKAMSDGAIDPENAAILKEEEKDASPSSSKRKLMKKRQRDRERYLHFSEERKKDIIQEKKIKNEERIHELASEDREQIKEREKLRKRMIRRSPPNRKIALSGTLPPTHSLSELKTKCRNCNALMFLEERVSGSASKPVFSLCCDKGKLALPPIEKYPEQLYSLYTANTSEAKEFRSNVRRYNQAFSMASVGIKLNVEEAKLMPYLFRVQGTFHHCIPPINPEEHEGVTKPTCLQLYFLDAALALKEREKQNSKKLSAATLATIQKLLLEQNHYAREFSRISSLPSFGKSLGIQIKESPLNRNSLPTVPEIAAIIPTEDERHDPRDIKILRKGSSAWEQISDLHSSYDPLCYPLLFPRGEPGWREKFLTACKFYRYRAMIRTPQNVLLGEALFQQYIVDAYSKVETGRCRYIRLNQDNIRGTIYKGLEDHLESSDSDLKTLGKRVILPASFVGGPRYMHQLNQDALAIVTRYGKPDLFVTMTCNPSWPEIKNNLYQNGQTYLDRADLTTRVFNLKFKEFLDDITERQIFGKVLSFIYVIEFQKRGLPHAHVLIILSPEDRPQTPADYDRFVCAEIPDQKVAPQLYETITKCNMHGPCGPAFPNCSCMNKETKTCKKHFPKSFQPETTEIKEGAPLYRRREDGRHIIVRGFKQDNRWVVPYNPYLSSKFNCHINVEICTSVTSIKYLYKYVYKGVDKATIQIADKEDEIKVYFSGRYLSPTESCWRLFKFLLHNEHPTIYRLDIHLRKQQKVMFHPEKGNEEIKEVLEKYKKTMLTEYFVLNKKDPEARNYYYHEIPEHYTWDAKEKKWKRRKYHCEVIGRVYYIPPNAGELFFLRVLLRHIKGAQSFKDLLKIETGEVLPSYKDVCRDLGLLDDDDQWRETLIEATNLKMPREIRKIFAMIIRFGDPSNPRALWEEFKEPMIEDFRKFYEGELIHPSDEMYFNDALLQIEQLILSAGGTWTEDLPKINRTMQKIKNIEIAHEVSYDPWEEARISNFAESRLSDEQRKIYNQIIVRIDYYEKRNNTFFVDGPAGTGKTFLYKALLSYVRRKMHIALACASSGIAALLLPGGRTGHSRFKIPLKLSDVSMCSFDSSHPLAELIKQTRLIIWDEAPMMPKRVFETLDRSLRDITQDYHIFGGKVVLFGGDFRQILPVIERGGRTDIVLSCFKKSSLWPEIHVMKLTINMRIRSVSQESEEEQKAFSEYLMRIGDGKEETVVYERQEYIKLKDSLILPSENVEDLIAFTFGDVRHPEAIFTQKAILTPLLKDVLEINNLILSKVEGATRTYLSTDKIEIVDAPQTDINRFSIEYINSLQPSGMPPHSLKLKLETPVMCLKNLNPTMGVCNGTRMILKAFYRNIIECEICHGSFNGQRVFIPKVKNDSRGHDLPFVLYRKQFPVVNSFAMTINKAQGQSLQKVGVFLPRSPFTHGQLYVALSRVSSPNDIKFLVQNGSIPGKEGTYIQNPVYKEVLN